jgi:polar amino acid transport system permease protein
MQWRETLLAGRSGRVPAWARILNLAIAIGLMAGAMAIFFARMDVRWNWVLLAKYGRLFAEGWLVTIGVSLAALALSLLIGCLAALAQRSRLLLLRSSAQVYVETFRGTPLLVQLFVFWYVLFYGAPSSWQTAVGILTLSVFSGAYITEIVRAGIDSVGASQWETARAIGLTTFQTYRFVVVPQALRQVLPPLAGQLASLIKDSSLLSVIGVPEFTLAAQNANSYSFSTFEAYLPLAIGYLALTLPISLWARWLESRARFDT